MFPLDGNQEAQATNVNLGSPIISETTTARKLKLKTLLEVVKYSLQVQNFFFRLVAFCGCRALYFKFGTPYYVRIYLS